MLVTSRDVDRFRWQRRGKPIKEAINIKNRQKPKECVLSLSYGKDSLACLGAIEQLGWPLDRILHVEIWATDTIPADLPPMVDFKAEADAIIWERWGIAVEHIRAPITYEGMFYRQRERNGKIYGFPQIKGNWCNSILKVRPLYQAVKGCMQYLGIAVDELARFHNLTETKKSPLIEAGWTEADCWKWCKQNQLLSPIYASVTRGGCWFCHNQSVDQLRLLRHHYPDYWALLLQWDLDSPVCFHPGHSVHDFNRRFQLEDEGFLAVDDPQFRWSMLEQELNYRLF